MVPMGAALPLVELTSNCNGLSTSWVSRGANQHHMFGCQLRADLTFTHPCLLHISYFTHLWQVARQRTGGWPLDIETGVC